MPAAPVDWRSVAPLRFRDQIPGTVAQCLGLGEPLLTKVKETAKHIKTIQNCGNGEEVPQMAGSFTMLQKVSDG